MNQKVFNIEGKKITMAVSGLTKRKYNRYFSRDLIADLNQLSAFYKTPEYYQSGKVTENGKQLLKDSDWIFVLSGILWLFTDEVEGQDEGLDDWINQFDDIYSLADCFIDVITELL